MRFAELALQLLDLSPEKSSFRRSTDLPDLEKTISDSLSEGSEPMHVTPSEPLASELYSVATRMGKSNYDEVAKAEALLLALKKMRAKNAAGLKSTRVIRST